MRSAELRSPDELPELRDRWARENRTVVWTNGCFDLFHAGHVHLLTTARAMGDVLVVGINSDESVRRLKGPERPLVALDHRIAVLRSQRSVDVVVPMDEDLPISAIVRLCPDVCCKDDTYAHLPLPERPVIEQLGGRMVLVPRLEGLSTTGLGDRLRGAVDP